MPDALSSRTMCEDIAVSSDSVVEETEVFNVILTQSNADLAVLIPPDGSSTANVTIVDSTGMLAIELNCLTHVHNMQFFV